LAQQNIKLKSKKNAVILMGKTGIGKSTIFNILSGKKCATDQID